MLSFDQYSPDMELHREALTVVGNGYLGVRGSFEGSKASATSFPGTYIAGLIDQAPSLPWTISPVRDCS